MTTIDTRTEILRVCSKRIQELDLFDDKHKQRLFYEIKQIDIQMEHDYFYDLYIKKEKFEKNDNNLFICYLLGLVDDFDINSEPLSIQGEYPDIDTDFEADVCDYIRDEWAPKTFGEENVCAIGTYGTFGIKSSLIDVARVFGKDRQEVLNITTKIGLKDEDGKALVWDTAIEEYPALKEYCDNNPDVAEATQRLLNRNKSVGTHAGGLIISSQRIDDLVPFVKTSDNIVSAFGEGLSGTDLGPLGFVKIDTLRLKTLTQIAKICRLVQERYNLKSICALPDRPNWSDEDAYIADSKAIALANTGAMRCIFQFDSDGIREMVKRGGVTCFNDLVAFSALFRPGPLSFFMDKIFIERKRGREVYDLHPVLKPILKDTHGVMIFQEQILKILRIVGDIPDMHCEIVRKAISKKKVKIFQKYKEMFVKNGQKVLGWTAEQVDDLFSQIQAFSEYGFNRSHSVAYTLLTARLLYLKAHYPIEFFAGTLNCATDEVKIKEYKREAETFNVKVMPVNINKSKMKFEIVDDVIYMGFSNIKGIGDDVGQKIVDNQPYASFENFLQKFGTEMKVIKPLVCLRLFEGDPIKLYAYYEYYKDAFKKVDSRNSRFNKGKEKVISEIQSMIYFYKIEEAQSFLENMIILDEQQFYSFCDQSNIQQQGTEAFDLKSLWKIIKKYKKSSEDNKFKNDNQSILSLDEYKLNINDIDPNILLILREVVQVAESQFYGFSWNHLIETSPDYAGNSTFAEFESDETAYVKMCEVQVVEPPKKKTSKNGNSYYEVKVEDANSCINGVTFWEEDYLRFSKDIEFWESDTRKGNFIKIRLKKPDPPFKNYTFESPPKHLRNKLIPEKREDDTRILVMSRPFVPLQKIETKKLLETIIL